MKTCFSLHLVNSKQCKTSEKNKLALFKIYLFLIE